MTDACPVCATPDPEPVFALENVPAHVAVVYPSPEAAREVARGDIRLVLCASCGHVWNAAFDPALTDYSEPYDASLHHSPAYAAFLETTADDIARRHRLHVPTQEGAGRLAVEVGCGEGTFLRVLSQRTPCDALGIDPSAPRDGGGVTYWRKPFSETHADMLRQRDVALVANRQMLHYIVDPVPFVRRMAAAGAPLYTEVPNGAWVFGEAVPWTVFYEHVAYFAPSSLARLLAEAGLGATVAAVYDGGQYLAAHSSDERPPTAPDPAHLEAVRRFGERARGLIETWRERLLEGADRTVVWGAAGRGTTFVGAMPEGRVLAVADNNPARQGSFVAGTGHPIVAPEDLVRLAPDRIVLTNATYADEIRRQLAALGVRAEVAIA